MRVAHRFLSKPRMFNMSDDDKTPRDHTDKILKPANERSTGMAPSPSGIVSVPQVKELHFYGTMLTEGKTDKKVDLSRNHVNAEPTYHGLYVQMWVDEKPSEKNISGGHISRMTVTDGMEKGREEKIFAHFENGKWDKEPDDPKVTQAIIEAKHDYNGIEPPKVKAAFEEASQKHKPKI